MPFNTWSSIIPVREPPAFLGPCGFAYRSTPIVEGLCQSLTAAQTNPGPKTDKNHRAAKSRFMSDHNVDVGLAITDPKELATKYRVCVCKK